MAGRLGRALLRLVRLSQPFPASGILFSGSFGFNRCGNVMIVLTLNSGSTSIKLAVYDTAMADAPVRLESEHHSGGDLDMAAVLAGFLGKLRSPPDVVAHRVVHGGTQFTGPVRIDECVEARITKLSELAPLHNPKARAIG